MHLGTYRPGSVPWRLRAYLEQRPDGATTWELQDDLRLVAAATWVSATRHHLRGRGEDIRCTYEGRTADGRRIQRYRLVSLPREVAA